MRTSCFTELKIHSGTDIAPCLCREFDFVRDSKATTGKAALYNPAHIWSSGSWKVPAEWEKDWPAAADKASFNAGKRPMKTKRPDALSSPLSKAVYPKKKAKQSSGELAPDRKISKN